MARLPLTTTKKWELVNSDQDLRGRDLWDAHGHRLGTIREMVLDTSTKRVEEVILDTGDQFAARDLAVDHDAVYVLDYDASESPPASMRQQREEPLERRPETDRVEADRADRGAERATTRRTYSDYGEDFRKHHAAEFGGLDRDFTDFEPAYRFGYDMAFESQFSGGDFDASEEYLRREYYRRMGYPMSDHHVWQDVRGAVRHAFEEARRGAG